MYSGFFRRWYRHKNLNIGVITAFYQPPDSLTPAEIGYIFDNRAEWNGLVSTLFSLEQKGLIRLERNDALRGLRAELTHTGSIDRLWQHEVFLLQRVGAGADFSELNQILLGQFNEALKEALVARGYIRPGQRRVNWRIRRILIAYVVIVVISSAGMLIAFGPEDLLFMMISIVIFNLFILWPAHVILAVLTGLLYNKLVGQPAIWTQKKKDVWPQVEGYREYIYQVEIDNIRFDSEYLKEASRNEALPYAIAFGFNTSWKQPLSIIPKYFCRSAKVFNGTYVLCFVMIVAVMRQLCAEN